jgi:RNA modification enzyme, miaB family
MLPELLKRLCGIEGIRWIRILYCYPEEITDELIDTIASEEKICHYLDIPIQHASDRILRRMARRTNQNDLKEIVGKLRKKIPDITLRTTLITGFPGETEEDFEILKDFVDEMQFERLGVFTYSEEEGTIAAGFENQVDEEVKEARREEIMLLQQEISLAHLQSLIGEELDVVIEGNIPDDGVYIGRTYMDVPGVDGYVFVESDRNHMSGDFVRVKITGASEYDLMGELV